MSLQTFDDKKSLKMSELLAGLDANFKDLARVGTYVLTATKKEGTNVYELTGLEAESVSSGIYSCVMSISNDSMDYEEGDNFRVCIKSDGSSFSFDAEVKTSDGEPLDTGAFIKGAKVPVVIDIGERTINFKLAGSKLKFLADSYLMVKLFTENGTFKVPKTGNYRVTCIGRGGKGVKSIRFVKGSYNSQYTTDDGAGGSGGGAGAAGSITLRLKRGDIYPISVNDGVSSFSTYLTSESGGDAAYTYGSNGYANGTIPGIAGSVKQVGVVAYTGRNGTRGGQNAPLTNDSMWPRKAEGGYGGAYEKNQNKFLVTKDSDPYELGYAHTTTYSPAETTPFGVGGGGQEFYLYKHDSYYGVCSSDYKFDGSGGKGAVIIEYLMDSYDLPTVSLNYEGEITLGSKSSITLIANASSKNVESPNELQYIWYKNGIEIAGENKPYLNIYDIGSTSTYKYSVRVFDGYGSSMKEVTIRCTSETYNVANGCTYQSTVSAHSSYPDSETKPLLTDGKYAKVYSENVGKNKDIYVGYSGENEPEITIDLGVLRKIYRVSTDVVEGVSSHNVKMADSVNFTYSEDDVDYLEFGKWSCPNRDTINPQDHMIVSCENNEGVNARFVKIKYNKITTNKDGVQKPSSWLFVSEIQVHGK